jgi:hypothetical protein
MLNTALALLLFQDPAVASNPHAQANSAGQSSPAATAANATAQSSPAAAAPKMPCASPLHRQFDFWLGLWDVTDPTGKFAGINRIELVDGGCALYESWSSGGGGYTGRSLNSVGGDGRWHQTWVDSTGGRLDLAGALVDGKMILEGDSPATTPGGPPVKNRITWTPQADGSVRQVWEASSDGGKSYAIAFDGLYHRVNAASQRPVTSPPTATGTPTATTTATADTPSLLRALAGGWIGTGTVVKKDAHVELALEPVLGGRYYRLAWTNSGGKDGRELFEGFAIYEQKPDGTLAATWWDSQGARHAIAATADAKALTALWGERGRTVYRLLDTGELEVTDSVKRPDGSWSEFGRTLLKRK